MRLKISAIVILIFLLGGFYAWKNYRGALPAVTKPNKDITEVIPPSSSPNIPEAVNATDFPLKLPKGFAISVLAKDLPGARVLAMDAFGNLWVSQTKEGIVSQIEIKNGQALKVSKIFKNLDRPHGLALDPAGGMTLYIAEETKISKVSLYSEGSLQKIADLPEGNRHYTRTLLFGADGRLYVSIGSTCDVCYEKDERIASIYSLNKDGSDFKKEAIGLRNSVFMATNPVDGKIWATEMGRDNLGNDIPPDEINIIENEKNYGWPICYGKNVHDTQFDPVKNPTGSDGASPCNGKIPAHIELPAHSAPLGLAFVPEEGWPEGLGNDLLVAFHGSWNRTEPTGYKIARVKLDNKGNAEGIEDFIYGWLGADGKTSLGRPVDILTLPGGIMYISDDKAGVVYKVQYLPTVLGANIESFKDLSVKENQQVSSPLKITGQTLGSWFFEGVFSISLMDGNFKEIATGPAQAKSDWMTENFVPFEAVINFTKPQAPTGWLVFKKDNPSGMPENNAEYHLPISF